MKIGVRVQRMGWPARVDGEFPKYMSDLRVTLLSASLGLFLLAACTQEDSAPTPTGAGPKLTRPWAVYDSDRGHIWNRLFRQFYERTDAHGQSYGGDVLDPPLWRETTYLLEHPAYDDAIALLDEFLSTDAHTIIADPLKRAMLQRDLWAVFDWVALRPDDRPVQRRELQARLSQVIRRLALTREQIQSLPDNYSDAVASGRFSGSYVNPGLDSLVKTRFEEVPAI